MLLTVKQILLMEVTEPTELTDDRRETKPAETLRRPLRQPLGNRCPKKLFPKFGVLSDKMTTALP